MLIIEHLSKIHFSLHDCEQPLAVLGTMPRYHAIMLTPRAKFRKFAPNVNKALDPNHKDVFILLLVDSIVRFALHGAPAHGCSHISLETLTVDS